MSKFLEKLAVPLAMAIAPGCVDAYPGSEQTVTANTINSDPQAYSLSQQEVEKTLCTKGNEIWDAVSKTLTCEEMTGPALKELALANANEFLDKLKGLISTLNVTPISSAISSSEFEAHTYIIGDPNGVHDVLQFFDGEHEALVYLYLDAKGDTQKGFSGSESYNYTLSADSFDVYHFENGEGCIKCGHPDLKVKDPTSCASETNAAVYGDGVYVLNVIANAQNKVGKYELNCPALPSVTEKFTSACVESKSEGSATCAIGADDQKNQVVDKRASLMPNDSTADISNQFLVLKDLANKLGFDLQPFVK